MAEKVTIQTLGPKKDIPNKKDPNSPWKSWSLQFKDDPTWYDTFWLAKEDPTVGQELSGTKSIDEKWGPKFELERQGGKSSWNPNAANATVVLAAVHAVNGWLALDPKNKKDWEGKAKEGEVPFQHYLRTITDVAKVMKADVTAMGGIKEETKTTTESSAAPQVSNNEPPSMESFPPDEEDVPLGPM